MFRRLPSILLPLVFLAIGSGAAAHVHHHQHAADAGHHDDPPAPAHDESDCVIHAQLKTPVTYTPWVPLLIGIGLFVGFLSLLAPALTPQRTFIRLDCRGPPSC